MFVNKTIVPGMAATDTQGGALQRNHKSKRIVNLLRTRRAQPCPHPKIDFLPEWVSFRKPFPLHLARIIPKPDYLLSDPSETGRGLWLNCLFGPGWKCTTRYHQHIDDILKNIYFMHTQFLKYI